MAQLGSRLFFYAMPEGEVSDEDLEEALIGTPYRDRVLVCRTAVEAFLKARIEEFGGFRGLQWDRSEDPVVVRNRLKVLARLVAALRGITSVWREGADDLGYTPPNIEEPYRALTCLYNLARGRALLHGRTALAQEDLGIVTHVALSSAPHERTRLLRALAEHGGTIGEPGGGGPKGDTVHGPEGDEDSRSPWCRGAGRRRPRRGGTAATPVRVDLLP